jgi:hypothetical protein
VNPPNRQPVLAKLAQRQKLLNKKRPSRLKAPVSSFTFRRQRGNRNQTREEKNPANLKKTGFYKYQPGLFTRLRPSVFSAAGGATQS